MSRIERGLLDTSTVILLGRIADPSLLPDEPVISAITLAELSLGPLITVDPDERADRQARLQLAESDFQPLPFDSAAARAFGGVAADLRRAGRKPAARAYDALVAAIGSNTKTLTSTVILQLAQEGKLALARTGSSSTTATPTSSCWAW